MHYNSIILKMFDINITRKKNWIKLDKTEREKPNASKQFI